MDRLATPLHCLDSHGLDYDTLILVDEADREIGYLGKTECHQGAGVLHRAFSILIFNGRGELLIQQRAAGKRLWPLYWSNTCCSHPRRDETMSQATHRRLKEELDLACPLRFLFKFRYQAQFDTDGAENEICSVYIGRSEGPVHPARGEIRAWRWISAADLQAALASDTEKFTPWFRLEWERIMRDHSHEIAPLTATSAFGE
ncbi:MAG TPA: isopentenyl-diphosphate Delta-isomerase [Steroidobacteraceae bacterium]|jgi:isopentenyl-diphosphate delta-isomerase|nr:isopentenyl-diphosphate Delta-isomerase [Steroidobacteraceae bacterium]